MTATKKAAPKKKPTAKSATKGPKTTKNAASVDDFLAAVPEPMREDAATLRRWMQEWTGEAAAMWGSAIVSFGAYRYKYESGRVGDSCAIGFSPRKQSLTLYFVDGFEERKAQLASLGKHSVAKSCLYVDRLADIDRAVLEAMVKSSIAVVKARYPA